jgi:alkaline phosphatase D
MLKKFLFSVFLLVQFTMYAQVISGPMLGDVQHRTAKIWVEVKPGTPVNCQVWKKGAIKNFFLATAFKDVNQGFETITFNANGLDYGTEYEYQISTEKKVLPPPTKATGKFTTKSFWAYRTAVPDVSFLTGSCSYINDTAYDRIYTDMVKLNKVAKNYGGDYSIFETMAKTPADMMMWLGDNWYTREPDYSSEWGLHYRPHHDRALPQLQNLLKVMPNYAIWDDHDYGPNDGDKSFILSNESRNVFKKYWANPTYGDGVKGTYSKVTLADVDFFMLDDRTWRSNDDMKDSINGEPNMEKRMLGYQQMDWLKNALLQSAANFKIIVTGSQTLNPVSPFNCFQAYPAEYQEFLSFLKIEKIKGLLFLTGDRHHTEVIKINRENTYPLYDVTVSPLTSGTHTFNGPEKNNPYRVMGIDEKQNFGKATVSGSLAERKLTFNFIGTNGEALGEWSIMANDLR